MAASARREYVEAIRAAWGEATRRRKWSAPRFRAVAARGAGGCRLENAADALHRLDAIFTRRRMAAARHPRTGSADASGRGRSPTGALGSAIRRRRGAKRRPPFSAESARRTPPPGPPFFRRVFAYGARSTPATSGQSLSPSAPWTEPFDAAAFHFFAGDFSRSLARANERRAPQRGESVARHRRRAQRERSSPPPPSPSHLAKLKEGRLRRTRTRVPCALSAPPPHFWSRLSHRPLLIFQSSPRFAVRLFAFPDFRCHGPTGANRSRCPWIGAPHSNTAKPASQPASRPGPVVAADRRYAPSSPCRKRSSSLHPFGRA